MKYFKVLLVSAVLLLVGCAVFSLWIYRELKQPKSHTQANQYIEIARGSTPDETISRLSSLGVIGREWPLLLYLRFSGGGERLKAGEYRFPSPISPLGVLKKLEECQQRLARFTVIEGWTRWDIATAMSRVP